MYDELVEILANLRTAPTPPVPQKRPPLAPPGRPGQITSNKRVRFSGRGRGRGRGRDSDTKKGARNPTRLGGGRAIVATARSGSRAPGTRTEILRMEAVSRGHTRHSSRCSLVRRTQTKTPAGPGHLSSTKTGGSERAVVGLQSRRRRSPDR